MTLSQKNWPPAAGKTVHDILNADPVEQVELARTTSEALSFYLEGHEKRCSEEELSDHLRNAVILMKVGQDLMEEMGDAEYTRLNGNTEKLSNALRRNARSIVYYVEQLSYRAQSAENKELAARGFAMLLNPELTVSDIDTTDENRINLMIQTWVDQAEKARLADKNGEYMYFTYQKIGSVTDKDEASYTVNVDFRLSRVHPASIGGKQIVFAQDPDFSFKAENNFIGLNIYRADGGFYSDDHDEERRQSIKTTVTPGNLEDGDYVEVSYTFDCPKNAADISILSLLDVASQTINITTQQLERWASRDVTRGNTIDPEA